MNLKLALAALVLAALPTVAAAECLLHGEKSTSATVCAEGQAWDAVSQSCVDTSA